MAIKIAIEVCPTGTTLVRNADDLLDRLPNRGGGQRGWSGVASWIEANEEKSSMANEPYSFCFIGGLTAFFHQIDTDNWEKIASSKTVDLFLRMPLEFLLDDILNRDVAKRLELLPIVVSDCSKVVGKDIRQKCEDCINQIKRNGDCNGNSKRKYCIEILSQCNIIRMVDGGGVLTNHPVGRKEKVFNFYINKRNSLINKQKDIYFGGSFVFLFFSMVLMRFWMTTIGVVLAVLTATSSIVMFNRSASLSKAKQHRIAYMFYLVAILSLLLFLAPRYWLFNNETDLRIVDDVDIRVYHPYWISLGDNVPMEIQVTVKDTSIVKNSFELEFNSKTDAAEFVQNSSQKLSVSFSNLGNDKTQTKTIEIRMPVISDEDMVGTLIVDVVPVTPGIASKPVGRIAMDVFPLSAILWIRSIPKVGGVLFNILCHILPTDHIRATMLPLVIIIAQIILEGLLLDGPNTLFFQNRDTE